LSDMKIITQKEAREQGLKKYCTGKRCKRGHVAEWDIDRSNVCIKCKRLQKAAYAVVQTTLLEIVGRFKEGSTLNAEAKTLGINYHDLQRALKAQLGAEGYKDAIASAVASRRVRRPLLVDRKELSAIVKHLKEGSSIIAESRALGVNYSDLGKALMALLGAEKYKVVIATSERVAGKRRRRPLLVDRKELRAIAARLKDRSTTVKIESRELGFRSTCKLKNALKGLLGADGYRALGLPLGLGGNLNANSKSHRAAKLARIERENLLSDLILQSALPVLS